MKVFKNKMNVNVIRVALLSMMITLSVTYNQVFAGDLFSDIKATTKTFYDQIIDLALPIAVLAFIIALAMTFFTGNPNESAKWVSLAKRTVFIYVCILLAASIFLYATNLLKNYSNVSEIWQ